MGVYTAGDADRKQTVPKIFISYSHDTVEHQERVLGLADRLRADGIDAEIDQYNAAPSEGWPLWCERQIKKADFVLLVCTAIYLRRVDGQEDTGKGYGVVWEARIIRQLLYDAGAVSNKFVPVLFSDASPKQIPTPIRGGTHYAVDTEDGYEELYRRLTGQPRLPRPELGPIRPLPTRRRQWSGVPIFRVPRPTEFFTGRDQILGNLQRILTASDETGMRKLVALVGMAGVGKSQTALEYAYRHRDDYRVVWWMTATQTGLEKGCIDLARELRLPEADQATEWEPDEARASRPILCAVKRWLEEKRDWLLILDNAGPPKEVLDFLPDSAAGHILVTSQLSWDWSKAGRRLPIEPWLRENSIEFLTKRTGQTDNADRLADELGDLPLLLEHAAAYVETSGQDFAHYLDLYGTCFSELTGNDDLRMVLATLDVSLRAAEDFSPVSGDLLRLFAFLAPNDIPRDLLSDHATALPQPLAGKCSNRIALDNLVTALSRYSLIKATPCAFAVHRLVQAVTRDRMTDTDRVHWANAAIAVIDAAFPIECTDVAFWPSCSRLSPHAEAALTVVMDRNFPSTNGRISPLVDRLARYLNQLGSFNTAEALLKQAIDRKEQSGIEDLELAQFFNDLVILLHAKGHYSDAKPFCQRALGIRQKSLDPQHADIAASLHSMGRIERNMARIEHNMGHHVESRSLFKEAESFFKRALAIRHAGARTGLSKLSDTLNSMAALYRFQGLFTEALSLVEKVLQIRQEIFGLKTTETAHAINHKGLILSDLEQYSDAELLFKQALDIREALLGTENYEVATSLHDLAELYRAQQRFGEARRLYERALTIRERLFPEHELTATTRAALAACTRGETPRRNSMPSAYFVKVDDEIAELVKEHGLFPPLRDSKPAHYERACHNIRV